MRFRKTIRMGSSVAALLFGIGCDTGIPAASDEPVAVPDGYELLWSDEFDGDTLDERVWNIEINGDGCGNRELEYYDRRGVEVGVEPESGRRCLILTARRKRCNDRPAISGRVNTMNRFAFRYGRVDALMRLPRTADGLWPAFWLMGDDFMQVGWPRCGEIDVVEMGHSDGIARGVQERYLNGACHWGPSWENAPGYARAEGAPYPVQGSFHLYTLIWDEERIAAYLDLDRYPDAAPYFEMDITDTASEYAPGRYFHKEFFLLFNLAVGGDFTGIGDIDGVTALAGGKASMYVDYVRVFRRKTCAERTEEGWSAERTAEEWHAERTE